jgi:hypothetical protein
MVMTPKVYFIGGPTLSGKSSVAAKLAQTLELEVLELDAIFKLLRDLDLRDLYHASNLASVSLVEAVMDVGGRCIVEGAWIYPSDVEKLQEREGFYPAFCGYAKEGLEERYKLAKNDGKHWMFSKGLLGGHDEDWLEAEHHKFWHWESQCNDRGIEYFDFSDFDDGSLKMIQHFKRIHDSA